MPQVDEIILLSDNEEEVQGNSSGWQLETNY